MRTLELQPMVRKFSFLARTVVGYQPVLISKTTAKRGEAKRLERLVGLRHKALKTKCIP